MRSSVYSKFILFYIFVAVGVTAVCSVKSAGISSFKTSADREGKQETTTFHAGETLYANAVVSNSPGKTTVKIYLTNEKGEVQPGSEIKVDPAGNNTANYGVQIPAGLKGGKFNAVAELLSENGEKKDKKTVPVTFEPAS